jgi:DNA-binding response OmpR family regulator
MKEENKESFPASVSSIGEKQMAAEILIVDDHQEFLHFMERALIMLGWSVITASNARDALDKLHYIKPNLILLDMRMPEIDGFELTRMLKDNSAYHDIPILAVTGLDTPENRRLCLEAGCDDFISKPFRVPELHNRMRRLLCKDQP